MAFIFSNAIRDIVRNRNLYQGTLDRAQGKSRGENAPEKLPHKVFHGITPNGTYFFCNLVYRKDVTEPKKVSILALIDKYANTQDHMERLRLKASIIETCGEQVEGIALLFSNSEEHYGFISGERVKAARWRDAEPLTVDANEMFLERTKFALNYYVFTLANEVENAPDLIRQYIQGDEQDDNIDTNVINAVNPINLLNSRHEHVNMYLQTACAAIQNDILKPQLEAVYNALQMVRDDEMKFKVTVLTLQLLHSNSNEQRKRLLIEYTSLATKLYGSKIPVDMALGIAVIVLAVGLVALSIVSASTLSLSLMLLSGILSLGVGLALTIYGKNEFYNENAERKRSVANTLFSVKKDFNEMRDGDALIPAKVMQDAGPRM